MEAWTLQTLTFHDFLHYINYHSRTGALYSRAQDTIDKTSEELMLLILLQYFQFYRQKIIYYFIKK